MENIIPFHEIQFSGLSTVDDIGSVFFWKDRVFRAIRHEAVEKVRELFSSGMLHELIENDLFPQSWITDNKLDGYGLVVEHEKIHPVTYPYEWSFSMLKDAATAVLKTNLIAHKYAYQTKDCHSFNIVFKGAKPVFVDLGSFEKNKTTPSYWIAYEEFLRSYYYPLMILSEGNDFIARSILSRDDQLIPHANYLLYKHPYLRLLKKTFLEKIIRLSFQLKRISSTPEDKIKFNKKHTDRFRKTILYFRNKNLIPFQSINLEKLLKKTDKLSPKRNRTMWSHYHDEFYAGDSKLNSTQRFERIINIIQSHKICSILELGGNQGVFSRLLKQNTKIENISCSDYDENAVDRMYLHLKNDRQNNITPLVLNFIFPIMTPSTQLSTERLKSDAVIALAVTHHLILSQNIPLERILKVIAAYSKKYVFIEFMPMGLYDGKNAPPVPPWYTVHWFREVFEKNFDLITEEKLEENRILFFGTVKA